MARKHRGRRTGTGINAETPRHKEEWLERRCYSVGVSFEASQSLAPAISNVLAVSGASRGWGKKTADKDLRNPPASLGYRIPRPSSAVRTLDGGREVSIPIADWYRIGPVMGNYTCGSSFKPGSFSRSNANCNGQRSPRVESDTLGKDELVRILLELA